MKDIIDNLKNNVTVIGLSGAVGSGKDHIAKNCFVKNYGFWNISLAWHVKIHCISHGEASYEEVFDTKPPRVRRLLQILATEQGRNLWGEDIWVHTMFAWMNLYYEDWGMNKFVVPDVRFPNEVKAIQKLDGKIYRVVSNREGRYLTSDAKEHSSEQSLHDNMDIFDGIIDNNRGSNLDSQVTQILEEIEYAKVASVDQ